VKRRLCRACRHLQYYSTLAPASYAFTPRSMRNQIVETGGCDIFSPEVSGPNISRCDLAVADRASTVRCSWISMYAADPGGFFHNRAARVTLCVSTMKRRATISTSRYSKLDMSSRYNRRGHSSARSLRHSMSVLELAGSRKVWSGLWSSCSTPHAT